MLMLTERRTVLQCGQAFLIHKNVDVFIAFCKNMIHNRLP
jgi:hypothetical protein